YVTERHEAAWLQLYWIIKALQRANYPVVWAIFFRLAAEIIKRNPEVNFENFVEGLFRRYIQNLRNIEGKKEAIVKNQEGIGSKGWRAGRMVSPERLIEILRSEGEPQRFKKVSISSGKGGNKGIFNCVVPIVPVGLLGAVGNDDFSKWMLNKAREYKEKFLKRTKDDQIKIINKTSWISKDLKKELKRLIRCSKSEKFTLDELPKDERKAIEAKLHRDFFHLFHRYSSTFDFDKDVKDQLLRRYNSNTASIRSEVEILIECWYMEVSLKEAVKMINRAVETCKVGGVLSHKGAVFSIIQVEGRHTVRVLAMPMDRYMAVRLGESDVRDYEIQLFNLINKMGEMGYFRGKVSNRLDERKGRLWLDFSESAENLFVSEKETGNLRFLPLQRIIHDELIEMIWLLIEFGGVNRKKIFNEPAGDRKHYIFEIFGYSLPDNPTLQEVSNLPMLRYIDELYDWSDKSLDKEKLNYKESLNYIETEQKLIEYFGEFGKSLLQKIEKLDIEIIPSAMTDFISTVLDEKRAIIESNMIISPLLLSLALIDCGLKLIIRERAKEFEDVKVVSEVTSVMLKVLTFMKAYNREPQLWKKVSSWSDKQKEDFHIAKYADFINHFRKTIEQRDYEFLVSDEGIDVVLRFIRKLYPAPFYRKVELSPKDRQFIKEFFWGIVNSAKDSKTSNPPGALDEVTHTPSLSKEFNRRVNLGKVIIRKDDFEINQKALKRLPAIYHQPLKSIIGSVAHRINGPPLEINIIIEPVQIGKPSIWYDSKTNTIHIQIILLTDLVPLEYAKFVFHHDFIIHAYQQILDELDAERKSLSFLLNNPEFIMPISVFLNSGDVIRVAVKHVLLDRLLKGKITDKTKLAFVKLTLDDSWTFGNKRRGLFSAFDIRNFYINLIEQRPDRFKEIWCAILQQYPEVKEYLQSAEKLLDVAINFDSLVLAKAKELNETSKKRGWRRLRAHEFVVRCLKSIVGKNYIPEQYVRAFEISEEAGFLIRIKFWNARKLRFLLNSILKMTNEELADALGTSVGNISY
ncbi:MAG: hypothetical protein H8D45_03540, partial [Bacteroidetes bacterium]|nr:hypothetical protein [Bacteroidota bacterium]